MSNNCKLDILDCMRMYVTASRDRVKRVTADEYESRLCRVLHYLARLNLHDKPARKVLRPEVMEQMTLMAKEAGRAKSTITKYVDVCKELSAWLHHEKHLHADRLIGCNPFRYVHINRDKRERKAITVDEYSCIEAHLMRKKSDLLIITLLGWHGGLRLTDAVLLKYRNVDEENKCIRYIGSKMAKLNRTNEVPMPDYVMNHLHKPSKRAIDDYISASIVDEHLQDKGYISARWIKQVREAGVHGKSFHCLRYGFVTQCFVKNVPLAVLKTMTGHCVEMAELYCRPDVEEKRKLLGL